MGLVEKNSKSLRESTQFVAVSLVYPSLSFKEKIQFINVFQTIHKTATEYGIQNFEPYTA